MNLECRFFGLFRRNVNLYFWLKNNNVKFLLLVVLLYFFFLCKTKTEVLNLFLQKRKETKTKIIHLHYVIDNFYFIY